MICDKTIGRVNLNCIVQNQNFLITLVFTTEGEPLDMSIYEEMVFEAFYSKKLVIRKSLGNGITVVDNNVSILIGQDETKNLPQQGLDYEFRLVNGTGENFYALKGLFNLQTTISR